MKLYKQKNLLLRCLWTHVVNGIYASASLGYEQRKTLFNTHRLRAY
jgi:hypothetical protein